MKYFITAFFLLFGLIVVGQSSKDPAVEKVKDAIWQLEENYWNYVRTQNLTEYRKLWDDQFIGYPSNNIITGKDHITDWIKDLYADKNRTFTVTIEHKATNMFGDIAMIFYDINYTWKNEKQETVKLVHSKITHTWRKTGGSWLIIGGMGATISETTVIK